MHDLALIGSHGLFGKEISKFYQPAFTYNSDNIKELAGQKFHTVFCAAPSANRRAAQANPRADLAGVEQIISVLQPDCIKRVVLIGTIDSLVYADTAYGRHRLLLENHIKQHFQNYYVLRFGNIVGAGIRKNVLYDLKHDQFLDCINLNSITQWYHLDRLQSDIEHALTHDRYEHTLVSEPIQVREIVQRFFPKKLTQIGHNPGALTNYNLPWCLSKQVIFEKIAQYLQ